jgi:uroporphyrinogen-III decarboxylase
VEISLQPWEAFKPDGVILFSDILTPLSGMNIPFDIVQGKGPIIADPIRSMEVQQWDHSIRHTLHDRVCGLQLVWAVSDALLGC